MLASGAALATTGTARAQDSPPPAPPEPAAVDRAAASRAALPEFMSKKRRMDESDIEKKTEGGYLTGLPLVNSDPNTGFGFGARVLYFNNGARESPMFEYTPYRHRAYAQAFFTTKGYQYHTLDYDGTYLGDSPYRLRASLLYEKNTSANYFGVGEATLNDLAFSAGTRSFETFGEYDEATRQLAASGLAYSKYDKYSYDRPQLNATIERDLFGGRVRTLAGVGVSYVGIRTYDGTTVKADDAATGRKDIDATMGPTRLTEDCVRGRALGCAGGMNNVLKLGIAYDSRDFEPDPNRGLFVDLTGELSTKYIGSAYDYARVTFSPRVYVSPFPELTDLVLAGRLAYSVQSADVPFFAMNTLAFTDGNRTGLGGLRSLRGYKQDRFIGRIAALANFEIRWTFVNFKIATQRFGLMLVPFLDSGRVFDSVDSFSFNRWKTSYGAGFRVAWNQATVIVVDYGRSREDSGLYINFNHPF